MARKVSFLRSLKNLPFRAKMGHKIDSVSKKLSDINEKANSLRLHNEQRDRVPNSLFRKTDPYLDQVKGVGRENDELHIIQLLTQSRKEEKLTIVPIVGMGGIGKTTLAKSIYNNPSIQQHFDVKAWLCVSVKTTAVDELLAKIYESLAGEECKSRLRPNLIKDLQKKLGNKRYFLVLDDVWDEEKAYWDNFKSCMLNVNPHSGSGILVTTRNLEIGTKAMSEDFHDLQSLPDDGCWSIFKERAFVAGRPPSPELEEIGRDIVKKCCGLPLLVNVIGGMLRNNNDKEKWLSIKGSKVWDLGEERDRVQNCLKLSFDNLPNYVVKQCFVYCSEYKKNTVLEREELIRLWMAYGLIQADERSKKEAEEVGKDIFQILVSNSLFQDVKTDEYGYVTCCMHDLLHDLSLSLSERESLYLANLTGEDIERIPRARILSQDERSKTNRALKKIISFVFKDMKNLSFHSFISVRILLLNGCGLKEIDSSLGELVHLRYLDLSNNKFTFLPKSFGKLYHLQTLKLFGCYDLKTLPEDWNKLVSLRHLMIKRDMMYKGGIPISNVGQLTSLRTLPIFRVGQHKTCQIAELGPLKHLAGELCITDLENISSKEDAGMADLSGKKDLNQIEFHWSSAEGANRNDKDVLEGLKPPENVKSLTIKHFSGDNFPSWVAKMEITINRKQTPLHKMVRITLSKCSSCLYLPILEHLPLLRDLVLEEMDNLRFLRSSLGKSNNVTVTGSMKPLSPSLRSLQLSGMRRLEKWIDTETTNSSTMLSPVLESLCIGNCPMITHLDECHPHPLVFLQIDNCKNLESIKGIQCLTSLQSLKIHGCHRFSEICYSQNYKLHPLKSLSITSCNKLTSLPRFDCFSFLNTLALGPFSRDIHSFPSLQGIDKSRNHLRVLALEGWRQWESIPEQVQHLTSLTDLTIQGFGIRELPLWLTNMLSIRQVAFRQCEGLDRAKVKRGAPCKAYDIFLDGERVEIEMYKP